MAGSTYKTHFLEDAYVSYSCHMIRSMIRHDVSSVDSTWRHYTSSQSQREFRYCVETSRSLAHDLGRHSPTLQYMYMYARTIQLAVTCTQTLRHVIDIMSMKIETETTRTSTLRGAANTPAPGIWILLNHRLRGSASTVLTATGQVNGR